MDGVRVLLCLCATVTCSRGFLEQTGQPVLFKCDFETDACGLENNALPGYSPQWKRHQGSLGRASIGPQGDHTTGSDDGHFMYVAFDGSDRKESTLISDNKFNPNRDGQCLTFWYNMYDRDDKEDKTVINVDSSVTNYVIWHASSAQEKNWVQAVVPIKEDFKFYIRLNGVRKKSNQAGLTYLAVDDIVLYNAPCDAVSKESVSKDSGPAPERTVITSCDFEADTCGWKADDWSRKTGQLYFIGGDHTTGDGYYLFNQFDDGSYYYVISSEITPKETKQCVTFYYILYSGQMYLAKKDGSGRENLWFSKGSSDDNEWNYVQKTVTSSDKYQLFFQLKALAFNRAALDDIKIYEGECPQDSSS